MSVSLLRMGSSPGVSLTPFCRSSVRGSERSKRKCPATIAAASCGTRCSEGFILSRCRDNRTPNLFYAVTLHLVGVRIATHGTIETQLHSITGSGGAQRNQTLRAEAGTGAESCKETKFIFSPDLKSGSRYRRGILQGNPARLRH